MNYIVYVIQNPDGKLYIGHTNNLERRLSEHNKRYSRYTSSWLGPWLLVHQEVFRTRAQAMKREKELKTGVGREFLKSILGKG
ncbi:MAG: Excinuclease ABC C subunit domain protein [Candidatus Jorgensenbacteria bacterium GW2011_GWA2_45_13]|uniref:Excinuclease ABC C subunit domain protein n=1 Tax=Candidatus Jorgensenbacteria bacterium GW2011_GWA2_45_13 TaxID=1618662 RepID=A0A0G1NAJ7_9BACT|nr:MAG: Excinuclease ABC C subunit domain protein [Candidatus Jorgensenbacteria bacterium GW2011_GWA2_45_13]